MKQNGHEGAVLFFLHAREDNENDEHLSQDRPIAEMSTPFWFHLFILEYYF